MPASISSKTLPQAFSGDQIIGVKNPPQYKEDWYFA